MAKRRKEKPREDTPQRATRLAREAAERRRKADLWSIWSVLLMFGVATALFTVDGYRKHGHLHLHIGLILCDAVLLVLAVYVTFSRVK